MAVDWLMSAFFSGSVGAFALIIVFISANAPMPFEEEGEKGGQAPKRTFLSTFSRMPIISILAVSMCFALGAVQVLHDESIVAVHMLNLKSLSGGTEISRKDADYAVKLFTLGGHVTRVLKPDVVGPMGDQASCIKKWDAVVVVEHRSYMSFRSAWNSRDMDHVDLPELIGDSYSFISRAKKPMINFVESLMMHLNSVVVSVASSVLGPLPKTSEKAAQTCAEGDIIEQATRNYAGADIGSVVALTLTEDVDRLVHDYSELSFSYHVYRLKIWLARTLGDLVLTANADGAVIANAVIDNFRLCRSGESHGWHRMKLIEFRTLEDYTTMTGSAMYSKVYDSLLRSQRSSVTTMMLTDLV